MSKSNNSVSVVLLAGVGAALGVLLVLGWRAWMLEPNAAATDGVTATISAQKATEITANASERPQISVSPPTNDQRTRGSLDVALQQMVPMGRGGPSQLRGRCERRTASEPHIVIACESAEPSFGGMYAQLDATVYRQKRIRFTGELRAHDFINLGGFASVGALWIRIQTDDGPMVNNGAQDGVRASGDWVNKELSVDVPANATMLWVGFWMEGYGQLWARNLRVDSNQ